MTLKVNSNNCNNKGDGGLLLECKDVKTIVNDDRNEGSTITDKDQSRSTHVNTLTHPHTDTPTHTDQPESVELAEGVVSLHETRKRSRNIFKKLLRLN